MNSCHLFLVVATINRKSFRPSKKNSPQGHARGLLNIVLARLTYLVSIVLVVVSIRSSIAGVSVVVVVVF